MNPVCAFGRLVPRIETPKEKPGEGGPPGFKGVCGATGLWGKAGLEECLCRTSVQPSSVRKVPKKSSIAVRVA